MHIGGGAGGSGGGGKVQKNFAIKIKKTHEKGAPSRFFDNPKDPLKII